MTSTDPASLQNLNDIVMPADVAWWPLATGWYVLTSVMVLMLGWAGYRWIRNWRANRYRRHALQDRNRLFAQVGRSRLEESRRVELQHHPFLVGTDLYRLVGL